MSVVPVAPIDIDKLKIYRAQLKPPKDYEKKDALAYQGKLMITSDIESFPYLVFGNELRLFTSQEKNKLKRSILSRRGVTDLNEPLTDSEQKELNEKTSTIPLTDEEVIKRGDKILELLSKTDPFSFKNVQMMLVKPGYVKPLSPSTIQATPKSKPVPKLLKPAGPKLIIRKDLQTFQDNIASDLTQFFYSPEGDITKPASLEAFHRGIKEAGLRKLRAIHKMDRIKTEIKTQDIEYDLRKYLAGKPSKYVNQVRFNKALEVADETATVTDEITVKSFHKITGVRKEEIKTLTLNYKEWLLKGRIYDKDVASALYPPIGDYFGYSLWKIWAGNMQRRLDKYMSTYTEPVETTKIAGLAYVKPGDETPSIRDDIPFSKVLTSFVAVTPPTPKPPASTGSVPIVNATPVSGPLATAQAQAITQRGLLAAQQQVVAQLNTVTLDQTVVSVKGVGNKTVSDLAKEVGFQLTAPSALLVSELLHMIRISKGIKLTDTYKRARQPTKDGLDQFYALNVSNDAMRELQRLDGLRNASFNDMFGAKLRGTTKISLADANDNILFDGSRASICNNYNTGTSYECDLVYSVVKPTMDKMKEDEEDRYKSQNTVRITKDGVQTVATITKFVNRTITYIACDDLTNKKISVALDEVDITDATPVECDLAKKAAEDQVRQQELEAEQKEQERLRLEAEKEEQERLRLEEERKLKEAEEAARKAEEEERIRQEEERKLKEAEEAARKAEEEAERLRKEAEEEQKNKILGIELTAGSTFGDVFTELKSGDDILFIVKTSLDDDDKDEAKYEKLRKDTSGHLVKYWYVENPDKQYEKITLTLSGQKYHFDPSITDSEFVISEYAGQVLADPDDNVQVDISNEIVDSAMSAVKALHDLGYVHGDIKLENMALKDGKIKLLDFGTTQSFSTKRNVVNTYKELCHKLPEGRFSLIDGLKDKDKRLIAKQPAWKFFPDVNEEHMAELTKELPGRRNKDIKLEALKQRIIDSEFLLIQETETCKNASFKVKEGLKAADAILFGGEAGTFSYIWSHKAPEFYVANGGMLVTPPYANDPLNNNNKAGNFKSLQPLFGDIDYAERFKLHDYWALTLAIIHMGKQQFKPYSEGTTELADAEKLSKLLFDDSETSWFSGKNKETDSTDVRLINPLKDTGDLKLFELVSIIFECSSGDTSDKKMTLDSLIDITTGDSYDYPKDLSEKWINAHYNMIENNNRKFSYQEVYGTEQTTTVIQEEDLGKYLYGVSSENVRKLFKPLYDALPKANTGGPAPKTSLFDYDSFSDAELDELNTEMEALDDEELEKMISNELDISDTGYSYDSSSDTGASNVVYNSSSDTGQSNAAYSYNSESEQSAAESFNNDSYNSDSDEDK